MAFKWTWNKILQKNIKNLAEFWLNLTKFRVNLKIWVNLRNWKLQNSRLLAGRERLLFWKTSPLLALPSPGVGGGQGFLQEETGSSEEGHFGEARSRAEQRGIVQTWSAVDGMRCHVCNYSCIEQRNKLMAHFEKVHIRRSKKDNLDYQCARTATTSPRSRSCSKVTSSPSTVPSEILTIEWWLIVTSEILPT